MFQLFMRKVLIDIFQTGSGNCEVSNYMDGAGELEEICHCFVVQLFALHYVS